MKRFLTNPSDPGLLLFLLVLAVAGFGVPCSVQGSEPASDESVEDVRERLDVAIRWLLRVAPRSALLVDEERRLERVEEIVEFSEKYDHDPFLITSMIYCESSFRPEAIGRSRGEIGLMQVHGGALRRCLERGFDLSTPRGQIGCGTWYLRDQIEHCGSVRSGLNSYASGSCSLSPKSRAARVVERRFRMARKLKGLTDEFSS